VEKDITYVSSTSQSYYSTVGKFTIPSWKYLAGKKIVFFDDIVASLREYRIETRKSQLPTSDFYLNTKGKKEKFWRKGMCFYNAVQTCETKYLVWLDSDVLIHKQIDIKKFLPHLGELVTCICPDGWHTETGFVIVDTEHSECAEWISEYKSYWYNGKISRLRKPWDGAVFFDSIQNYNYRNLYARTSNQKPAGFTDTPLLEYMTHFSGKQRKKLIGQS